MAIESLRRRCALDTRSTRSSVHVALVLRNAGRLRRIECALAVLLLVAFFCVRDLPLVDLPQHALQIANWVRIDVGQASVSDLELNFRTPYLLAYSITRALCWVLPVAAALKLVFWASIVLQALALRWLCQRLGHDPWLGLLGYPLGLGYSFCWGFVAFCAALPLAYLAFGLVAAHRESPRLQSGVCLALTLALLFVAHGVALGFCVVVAGPLLVGGAGKRWQRLWPLLSPALLGLVWLVPGRTSTRLGGDVWALELRRWLELPGQLVGIGASDAAALLFGVLLILVLVSSLGPRRPLAYALPLMVALAGYGLFPSMFRGAGPLHPRFSAYLVPALLLAFAPRGQTWLRVRRALALGVSLGVVLIFSWRALAFNREAADFRRLVSRMPAGLVVRPLVFERTAREFPGNPAHLHVPAYYCVEKGGSCGYSFAMYSISVVRYRPGVRVLMGGGSEWAPERFDAAREAADYDYFIVRSTVDLSRLLFSGPSPAALLDAREGDWWGYRRAPTQNAATKQDHALSFDSGPGLTRDDRKNSWRAASNRGAEWRTRRLSKTHQNLLFIPAKSCGVRDRVTKPACVGQDEWQLGCLPRLPVCVSRALRRRLQTRRMECRAA